MTAETIGAALGGRRVGGGWMARCPAHNDRTPSLSLVDSTDGRVLVRCHACCNQDRVITALRACGLWAERPGPSLSRANPAVRPHRSDLKELSRTEAALRIWSSARGAAGTPVEFYLRHRHILLVPPAALRFHPGLKHPSGDMWPVMVALVTRGSDDTPIGIHRTFLAPFGGGKAPLEPSKMMLGPCRGGAVRLAPPTDLLMIGEGIETCLAAMRATGHPAWAALSTAGLRTLELPTSVRNVIVLADGDDAGEAAARACALRWTHQGRRVRIARPPRGMDFNDMLVSCADTLEGGRQ